MTPARVLAEAATSPAAPVLGALVALVLVLAALALYLYVWSPPALARDPGRGESTVGGAVVVAVEPEAWSTPRGQRCRVWFRLPAPDGGQVTAWQDLRLSVVRGRAEFAVGTVHAVAYRSGSDEVRALRR